MYEVTPEEAQRTLAELIEAALRGDRVLIASDPQHAVQLVPVARESRTRHAGTARGLIAMRDDFDAPLPDFDEYPV